VPGKCRRQEVFAIVAGINGLIRKKNRAGNGSDYNTNFLRLVHRRIGD
jgi:hypothetical protein